MPSRWDLLLEQKPIPILEHLVEEVSKLLAKDLEQWPPPLQDFDPRTGASFAPLLAPDYPRPQPVTYSEAFRLARWELEHALDAYDDYVRNARWTERGLPPSAKQELLFLSRWLTEQMFGLGEATAGRIKRRQMIDCLERTERRLLGGVGGVLLA